MRDAPLLNLVLMVMLVILVGWLLYVGRTILLPICTAFICLYVMVAATESLRKLPVLRNLPTVILHIAVIAVFAGVLLSMGVIISSTVRQISAVAPVYEANFDKLIVNTSNWLELDTISLWEQARTVTVDRIDLERVLITVLGGFTSLGTAFFLTIVYTAFLMGERASFAQKMAAAFPDPEQAKRSLRLVSRINKQIRSYIAVKTLINVILAFISYVILWALDVDFALFWAVMIGLLNYIPYVGSYIGVAFPVVLSLAQFGEAGRAILLLVLLTGVQFYIGNILEPRMIGKQLNLSPFVVLVSLSVWVALWGVPGAILAVPLTSILAIILSSFDTTRPVAIFLSGTSDEEPEAA